MSLYDQLKNSFQSWYQKIKLSLINSSFTEILLRLPSENQDDYYYNEITKEWIFKDKQALGTEQLLPYFKRLDDSNVNRFKGITNSVIVPKNSGVILTEIMEFDYLVNSIAIKAETGGTPIIELDVNVLEYRDGSSDYREHLYDYIYSKVDSTYRIFQFDPVKRFQLQFINNETSDDLKLEYTLFYSENLIRESNAYIGSAINETIIFNLIRPNLFYNALTVVLYDSSNINATIVVDLKHKEESGNEVEVINETINEGATTFSTTYYFPTQSRVDVSITNNKISGLNYNMLLFFSKISEISAIKLDEILNPSGDTHFQFANKHLHFTWVAPVPGADHGAFEIEASGAFRNDLIHIHQHTGNPGATNLVHIEAVDDDVNVIHLVHGSNILTFNKDGLLLNADMVLASGRKIDSADEDLTFTFGRVGLGHPSYADSATFGHRDNMTVPGRYALFQNSAGQTILNARSGQTLTLRNNTDTKMTVGSTLISLVVPLAMGSNPITGCADPTNPKDVATKQFVENSTIVSMPIGFIGMFSGTWIDNSTIPGWYKCDGNNGTINLVDKFIRGGTTSGATGGSDDAVVVSHRHLIGLYQETGSGTGHVTDTLSFDRTDQQNSDVSGVSGVGANKPAYYTLIFIQRIS